MAIRNYIGIAERAGIGWSMSFPAFPGTVTAGDTFAELCVHAKDALASVIEAMQEDGLEIPESFDADPKAQASFLSSDYEHPHITVIFVEAGGKALRINVTMDEALVARVDSLADRLDSSRSAILARGARLVLASEMTQ